MEPAALLDLITSRAPALREAGVRELELKDGTIRRVVLAPPDVAPASPDDRAAPTANDPLFDSDTFGRSKVPGSTHRRGDDDDDE